MIAGGKCGMIAGGKLRMIGGYAGLGDGMARLWAGG